MLIESICRITKAEKPAHLRASHCKPRRDSEDEERLNGENGLLLTPPIDHLFDRGFISFEDSGPQIILPIVHARSLQRMEWLLTSGERWSFQRESVPISGLSSKFRTPSTSGL
jgi:predicted restriction endonuclease